MTLSQTSKKQTNWRNLVCLSGQQNLRQKCINPENVMDFVSKWHICFFPSVLASQIELGFSDNVECNEKYKVSRQVC